MFVRLALIACSLVGILSAKDIPLKDVQTLYIPLKAYSVIEFPFEIAGQPKTSNFFSVVQKKKEVIPQQESIAIPKLSSQAGTPPANKNAKGKGGQAPQTSSPVVVDFGKNSLQLFAKKVGHFDVVVWGHKYPVILRIIVDEKLGGQHYTFVDYDTEEKNAAAFESDPHEKVLEKLNVSLYNNETPKGYKALEYVAKFTEGDYQYILIQTLFGKDYIGEEWRLKRLTSCKKPDQQEDEGCNLYPGMFDLKGIYSVSFEQNRLAKGESTRMFIIRMKSGDTQ